jgi:hypothetical protein
MLVLLHTHTSYRTTLLKLIISYTAGAKGSKSKSDRLFVQWLLDTYGEEPLKTGSGVLDVAGGKGEVSFELHCRHGIHSTLIDNRPYKLRKYQRKMIRRSLEQGGQEEREGKEGQGGQEGQEGQAAAAGRGEKGKGGEKREEKGKGGEAAGTGRGAMDVGGGVAAVSAASGAAVEGGAAAAAAAGGGVAAAETGAAAGGAGGGATEGGASNGPSKRQRRGGARGVGCFEHIQALFDDELLAAHSLEGSPLFADCSLIVGMHPGAWCLLFLVVGVCGGCCFWWLLLVMVATHTSLSTAPVYSKRIRCFSHNTVNAFAAVLTMSHRLLCTDQATEPIVDFALARDKPFAVVPCCVFPKLFPERRLPEGVPVVDYPQFVRYLQLKSPSIRTGYLNTKGRNLVLYSYGSMKPPLSAA